METRKCKEQRKVHAHSTIPVHAHSNISNIMLLIEQVLPVDLHVTLPEIITKEFLV
jgi:hypothetical protein